MILYFFVPEIIDKLICGQEVLNIGFTKVETIVNGDRFIKI